MTKKQKMYIGFCTGQTDEHLIAERNYAKGIPRNITSEPSGWKRLSKRIDA